MMMTIIIVIIMSLCRNNQIHSVYIQRNLDMISQQGLLTTQGVSVETMAADKSCQYLLLTVSAISIPLVAVHFMPVQ
jgi:hypothetical protein